MKRGLIKILLIEDDFFVSEIYYRKLTDAGFRVKLAKDGLEGLVFFEEFQPDLVLLDIMLPKKDGWEVLKEIRVIENRDTRRDTDDDAKIIIFTNLGGKANIKKALELGANDYLVKASLTPTELVEEIKDRIE